MVPDDEKDRKEFSKRLIEACLEFPPTTPEHGRASFLARAIQVSPKGASKWLDGEAKPRDSRMKALSKLLNVNYLWLRDGIGEKQTLYKYYSDSNIPNAVQEAYKKSTHITAPETKLFPILNSTQAARPTESIAAGHVIEYLGVHAVMKTGTRAFYFKIEDDSMTSADHQIFRRGSVVLIDPDGQIEPGMFVLARVMVRGEEQAVFRAYFERESVNDFESFELVPINRAVRNIRVNSPDDGAIIGVLAGVVTAADNLRYNQ